MYSIAETIYAFTGTSRTVIADRCQEYADMHQVKVEYFVRKGGQFTAFVLGMPWKELIEDDMQALAYAHERYGLGVITSWFLPVIKSDYMLVIVRHGQTLFVDGPQYLVLPTFKNN